jgi:hypothetical protein
MSYVRCGKIFTASSSIIEKIAGRLQREPFAKTVRGFDRSSSWLALHYHIVYSNFRMMVVFTFGFTPMMNGFLRAPFIASKAHLASMLPYGLPLFY